jgi:hypothetical protein
MEVARGITYEFDELTAHDVLDEIDGLVVRILNLPKDKHLTELGVQNRRKSEIRTIWEISWVYL